MPHHAAMPMPCPNRPGVVAELGLKLPNLLIATTRLLNLKETLQGLLAGSVPPDQAA